MSALNTQAGGDHYKGCAIQPIQYIHANGLDFFQGNIVKYATRHKAKNGAEDLKKVIHYAQLALELQYGIKPTDELADMTRAGLQLPSIVGHTPTCWCEACDLKINGPLRTKISVCPVCHDAGCPRSKDHRNECNSQTQAKAGKGAQA